MVETRSGLNTSAPSSSESDTMPKESTSLLSPDLFGNAFFKLDKFLEDERQSVHYDLLGSPKVYLVQRDQTASAAAIVAICSQATPSAVTSSTPAVAQHLYAARLRVVAARVIGVIIITPQQHQMLVLLASATRSTKNTANTATNTGVFNKTPLLGPTFSLPLQFASQLVFSGQFTGQSGLSGLSKRRFPTTVKKDDIPRFDGRLSSWFRFQERFVLAVGENSNLKEIDKLNHLATAIPSSTKTDSAYLPPSFGHNNGLSKSQDNISPQLARTPGVLGRRMAKKSKNLTKEQEQAMKQLEDLATEIYVIYGIVASGTNDLRPKPYDLQTCVTLTDAVGDLVQITGLSAEAMNTYDLIGKIAELLKKKHTNTGLQPFDGSPARYKQFEQLFENIIEHDGGYSDAEKLVAFRNLVGHHRDQFISSLRPNHDGLQKAKQRLKCYFDDPVLVREDATEKIN
ncbi:hypothetical protein TYRP_018245 [Tyrophagus putrescentiae]|nr:hypothetical protein TYRP_018245 [Tyrophagus putrescentiae]